MGVKGTRTQKRSPDNSDLLDFDGRALRGDTDSGSDASEGVS